MFGPACFRSAMTVQQTILLALAALLLGEEVPEAVQRSGNWWGGNSAAISERQLFDARRDPQLGIFTFQPQMPQPLADAGPQ